jgi:hypothetical protein
MKYKFLISLLAAFFLVISVNAQDRELQRKAIQEAHREAKKLVKEGFKTPEGKLPLDKQLENSWQKQVEADAAGNPFWYVAFSRAIDENTSAAVASAAVVAKKNLALQIESNLSKSISASVEGNGINREAAASLTNIIAANKEIISTALERTIPLVEIYRTMPDDNVEVMITLAYSIDAANQVAVQLIRDKLLANKSKELVRELDKLGY